MKAGGAAMGKLLMKVDAKERDRSSSVQQQPHQQQRQQATARGGGGGRDARDGRDASPPPPKGILRLQLGATGKSSGGPVVVSYDEHEGREFRGGGGGGGGAGRGQVRGERGGGGGGGNTSRSLELNGDSEYLRIGGGEADLISGDQLDRLLVAARRAKAANR